MFEYNFKITNLTCEACVKLSNKALKSLPGVQEVNVNLATGDTKIKSQTELNWEDIKNNLATVNKTVEK